MARITLRQLLDPAAEYGYCLPALNINNMDPGLAIRDADHAAQSLGIMSSPRGAPARRQTRTPSLTGRPCGQGPTKVTWPVGARITLLGEGRDVLLGW